tara:strand:+ start:1252 stop:2520 length:1269 start_codon:yes stop_codon:yes gene_type:complete
MAITDNQKIDYLFKKIGYGATKTDTNANKLAPNEAIASPLLIRGDRVWKQSDQIPGVRPGSTSSIVQVYTGANVVETTEDNTATTNRTWKTELTGWIPPQFGSTYIVSVYIHTSSDAANAAVIGNKVFVTGSGNDDEWFFDYESGVLNFIGTSLPNGKSFSGKSVYVEGARYVGDYGVGGSTGAFTFTDNRMQTTNTNEEIIIEPAGSGYVTIDATSGLIVPVGTTGQRPTGQAGMLRFNSGSTVVEVYNGSAWTNVGAGGSSIVIDEFAGDDSDTTFSLTSTATVASLLVSINGVVQETDTYAVSGTTLTFSEAPATGDSIQTRNFFSGATVDVAKLQDADSDTKIQLEEGTDDDTIRFDAAGTEVATMTSAKTAFSTAVQLASMTTTQRNALSAANGMLIYNTTDNKFQGYENGGWANLI